MFAGIVRSSFARLPCFVGTATIATTVSSPVLRAARGMRLGGALAACPSRRRLFHGSARLRNDGKEAEEDGTTLDATTKMLGEWGKAKLASVPYQTYVAEVEAFAARVNASFDVRVLVEALTHQSYVNNVFSCNDSLSFIGHQVLSAAVAEHVYLTYPRLPPRVWKNLIHAYIGHPSIELLAKDIGIAYVMRWGEPENDSLKEDASKRVIVQGVHALVGAFYSQQGMKATREWIAKFILSRRVDVEPIIEIKHPVQRLVAMLGKRGLAPLEFRMINESARASNKSMFFVGAFSGVELLGEGSAARIKDAEKLAARDALLKYYLAPAIPAEKDESGQILRIPLENVLEL